MTGPQTVGWGETWPALPTFTALAAERRVVPVVRRLLADDVTPVGLYRRLAQGRVGTFVLESAESDGTWGQWSFIGVTARAGLVSQPDGEARWWGEVPSSVRTQGDVVEVLADALSALHTPQVPGLPPLTGGFVGALGWDVIHHWEPTLPRRAPAEHDQPDVGLLLIGDMVAVDHRDGSLWLIANAFLDETQPTAALEGAYRDAVARLDAMVATLAVPAAPVLGVLDSGAPEPEVKHRTAHLEFTDAVTTSKQAIVDGEVFQVVLSQRFDVDCPADPLDVYRVLRTVNPSPYMYLVHLPDGPEGSGQGYHVVGSSPETLVKVAGRQVTSFPIAGSRPRGATPAEDKELADELLVDPKECAEHLMLVDLARNDLGKVCVPGTVAVVELMEIKRFSHIMHMSSTVSGELRPEATALEAFKATFPAGTLSGAPKPRAIALIDELEPARRGIYGGVVGYFDLAGDMDTAIAIRTAVIADGHATVQAGAGLVADSDPETEYVETRNKAAAALRAIRIASTMTSPVVAP
ncbi:anthranilate synthase component I [Pseudactinotalea terrae]|uniref:anthranilate synthase component I n=1 Tax=Pseudactinotalea terrae TaxID=1743262 RepID=UPI0012E15DEA|nr:anthranilate synthase component I [Pseudactinotalea terrae]